MVTAFRKRPPYSPIVSAPRSVLRSPKRNRRRVRERSSTDRRPGRSRVRAACPNGQAETAIKRPHLGHWSTKAGPPESGHQTGPCVVAAIGDEPERLLSEVLIEIADVPGGELASQLRASNQLNRPSEKRMPSLATPLSCLRRIPIRWTMQPLEFLLSACAAREQL